MAMKLNMEKAFDRPARKFIETCFNDLEFFIEIDNCIVQYIVTTE